MAPPHQDAPHDKDHSARHWREIWTASFVDLPLASTGGSPESAALAKARAVHREVSRGGAFVVATCAGISQPMVAHHQQLERDGREKREAEVAQFMAKGHP